MNKKSETIGSKFLEKYPDKIPVIVDYENEIKFANNSVANKFLVPSEITIGYLLLIIRKNANISHTEGLTIIINDTIPATSSLLSTVYSKHKNEEDCLHINVIKENVFGSC